MLRKKFHACVIAGAHSGVGKTSITLGLLTALRRRGLPAQGFKCGPDFIDAGHQSMAAGRPARNLDTWMMGEPGVKRAYAHAVQGADVAVVEGVMGLFDGMAADSIAGSTAHVARLLGLPVLLAVNARSMARSLAALVKGYAEFEQGVKVIGVLANGVSSQSHAATLQRALEAAGLPPLLACLPQDDALRIPERNLGLAAGAEIENADACYAKLADWIERRLDVDALLERILALRPNAPEKKPVKQSTARMGVARDKAFHFYYEDNFELLRAAGVELVFFSPLSDPALPDGLDGLFFGGGFPELYAEPLSANKGMLKFSAAGGKIMGEAGGFLYLCKSLRDALGKEHEMCGVLPAAARMEQSRQCMGYLDAVALADGPFGAAGTCLRGHEFHWASFSPEPGALQAFNSRLLRDGLPGCAGLRLPNVWGSFIHVHLASHPNAADNWAAWLRETKA